MGINLNFTDVERPSFDPIPEGQYVLRVEDVQVKTSKNDKALLIAHCVFSVTEGEYEDRKIFHYQGLNSKDNLPYAKVMFEAILGEPLDGDLDIEPEDLEGRVFEAFVGQRADNRDNTKMQNVIKYFILPFDTE